MSQASDGGALGVTDVDAGSRPWWRRLLDFMFGYDFFISYSWHDGGVYAGALARQLEAIGFEVFLDRTDYAAGDDWKKVGAWTLRRAGQLILVGSPQALTSAPVLREVQISSGTGRRIVPIDFGGSLEFSSAEAVIARFLPADILRIREPAKALKDGPTEDTVSAIRRTFTLVRQDKKRIRVLAVVAFLLAAATVAAGWFALLSRNRAEEANKQRARAEAEAQEAVRQRDRALRVQVLRLARESQSVIVEGDAQTALLLALEVLHEAAPFLPEPITWPAERSAADALAANRERAVLRGHEGFVASVTFLNSNDSIASAGQDGTVRM